MTSDKIRYEKKSFYFTKKFCQEGLPYVRLVSDIKYSLMTQTFRIGECASLS